MGEFDWLGQIPPPQKESGSNKQLSTPKSEKQPTPAYADRGVAYTGYSKKQVAEGQWILIPQDTRFYSLKYQNVASPTTDTVTRANTSTHTFICTSLVVQHDGSFGTGSDFVDLYDGNIANPRFRVWLTSTDNSFSIDLQGCPRRFFNDIIVYIPNGVSSLSFFHVELFGFDEEK